MSRKSDLDQELGMTKIEFSKIILSRWLAMDLEQRYFLISCLFAADFEINECDGYRVEEAEEFEELSEAIKEILFPEVIGIRASDGEIID